MTWDSRHSLARRLGYALGLAGPILLAAALCGGIPLAAFTYYARTR